MTEEQEQGESAVFDENPPVDPSHPRVGNSKARFFVQRDEDEHGSDEDVGSERDDGEASES